MPLDRPRLLALGGPKRGADAAAGMTDRSTTDAAEVSCLSGRTVSLTKVSFRVDAATRLMSSAETPR